MPDPVPPAIVLYSQLASGVSSSRRSCLVFMFITVEIQEEEKVHSIMNKLLFSWPQHQTHTGEVLLIYKCACQTCSHFCLSASCRGGHGNDQYSGRYGGSRPVSFPEGPIMPLGGALVSTYLTVPTDPGWPTKSKCLGALRAPGTQLGRVELERSLPYLHLAGWRNGCLPLKVTQNP